MGLRRNAARPYGWAKGLVVLLLVASSIVLVSPGSVESATKACLPAPGNVTIGTFPYGNQLPVELAQGLGLFDKIAKQFCTTVTLQPFQSSPPQLAGLASGQLQFAVYPEANNLLAMSQGLNPVPEMVAAITQGGSVFYAAKPSAKATYGRGLAALAKFAQTGKPMAIASLGSGGQLDFDALLSAGGFDPASGKFVAVGAAGTIAAVLGDQVELAQVPVSAGSLVAAGKLYNVLYGSGLTNYKATGAFIQQGLNVLPSFAKQYPQLTEAVVSAVLQGLFYIRLHWKDPGGAYNLLTPSYHAVTPFSNWTASWRYVAGVAYPVSGLFTQGDAANVARLMVKYGLLPSSFTLPTRGLAEPSFVKSAYKSAHKPVPTSSVYKDLIGQVPN